MSFTVNICIISYLKQSPSFIGKGSPVLFLSPSITHVPARTVPYSKEGSSQICAMQRVTGTDKENA